MYRKIDRKIDSQMDMISDVYINLQVDLPVLHPEEWPSSFPVFKGRPLLNCMNYDEPYLLGIYQKPHTGKAAVLDTLTSGPTTQDN